MRKVYITVALIFFAVAIFVVADYFALFGTKHVTSLEMVETIIKPINEDTGQVILDPVRIRCVQKGVENACTQKPSKLLGQIRMNVPITRISVKTLLFTKEEGVIKNADPNLHVWLFHGEYGNMSTTIAYEDILNSPGKEYLVKIKPKTSSNIENE